MRRWLPLVVALLWASPAHADFIDFTALDLTPTSTMQIGGLTISGESGFLVAIQEGLGLGVVGMGANGSIDDAFGYGTSVLGYEGNLALSVDGVINAFTIQPYMVIDGPAPINGVFLGFQMSFLPDGDLAYGYRYTTVQSPFDLLTFDLRSGSTIVPYEDSIHALNHVGMGADFSRGDMFSPYINSHPGATATFSYGFSIVSIDYTPTPEPATLSLMALGLGLLVRRRPTSAPLLARTARADSRYSFPVSGATV